MKKIMTIFGALMIASLIMTSCSNKCAYKGCDAEATGWSGGRCERLPGATGGYCSRAHCSNDKY